MYTCIVRTLYIYIYIYIVNNDSYDFSLVLHIGLRVPLHPGADPAARLHLQPAHDHHPLLRRQQARRAPNIHVTSTHTPLLVPDLICNNDQE